MEIKKATPEVENWVISHLVSKGIQFYDLDGYSVRNGSITALFERRESDIEVDNLEEEQIKIELKKEDVSSWEAKYYFSLQLEVPLYLIIWKEGIDKFMVFEVITPTLDLKIVCFFEEDKAFAEWIRALKSINVKKRFVENERLSSIDICLRKYGVPWAGNLDGFIYNNKEKKVDSIFEFSRTRKNKIEKHDIRPFFGEDYNRWAPFEILRKQAKAKAFVILWSSSERIIRLQEVDKITNTLYFKNDTKIKEEELFKYFK